MAIDFELIRRRPSMLLLDGTGGKNTRPGFTAIMPIVGMVARGKVHAAAYSVANSSVPTLKGPCF